MFLLMEKKEFLLIQTFLPNAPSLSEGGRNHAH